MPCIFKPLMLGAVLLSSVLQPAVAGPSAYASISSLSAKADAIVIGPVQATRLNGVVSATITAARVLKGSVTQGTSIPITWTDSGGQAMPASNRARTQTDYGLFFLQRDPSGSWTILPTINGDIYWSTGAYKRLPQSAPQAVRNLVSASLPSKPSALDSVLVEILVGVELGAPVQSEQLIWIFRQTKSPVLAAMYARFLSRPDPEFVCEGLRGSLVGGDSSVITTIRQRASELSSARSWPSVLEEVKEYYVNTSPQIIQTLGQMATDNSVAPDLRAATAKTLARMHTRESLPYLAKLLDDKDAGLNSMAVGGLSMFANNVPIGSYTPAAGPWPYRNDATIAHAGFNVLNVSFWQNWWQQNQQVIMNFQ